MAQLVFRLKNVPEAEADEEEDFAEFDGLDFNEGLDFEDTSIYQVAEAVSEYQYEQDYTDRPVKDPP